MHVGSKLQLSFTYVTGIFHKLKTKHSIRYIDLYSNNLCVNITPPWSVGGAVRGEKEMLLGECHLITVAAYSDQWESFLGCPWGHHLRDVPVLCRELHLKTDKSIQVLCHVCCIWTESLQLNLKPHEIVLNLSITLQFPAVDKYQRHKFLIKTDLSLAPLSKLSNVYLMFMWQLLVLKVTYCASFLMFK